MKLSIITAVYNSRGTIARLIDSVRYAKCSGVEWIVVDGCSDDGTVDILKGNMDLIDHLVVEPDDGIYDAWNKGLLLASGEYVAFVGADDYLDHRYCREAISSVDGVSNIVAVTVQILNGKEKRAMLHTSTWKKPYSYPLVLGFHHQGTLHHRSLFDRGLFDSDYKIVGDREFLTRISDDLRPKVHVTPYPLLFFSGSGLSSRRESLCVIYCELMKIMIKYWSRWPILLYGYVRYLLALKLRCGRGNVCL